MKVKVCHLDQTSFSVQARHHIIVSDQPPENGGEDAGMTPPELLLASLGSCVAYYAVLYLKTRKLSDRGMEVTVTAEKVKHPSRLDNFHVKVACPVLLLEEQQAGLMRSIHQCLIHNTLMSTPHITIECQTEQLAYAQAASTNAADLS